MMNKDTNKIDPRLENLLDELHDVPARDPKRVAQGRARFLSQAVVIREEAVSLSSILRLREWLDKNKPKEFKMTTLVSIITILGLLMGGTGGTVYASQDSLPNDALYGIKIASENFRRNIAGDAEAQLELALEFAQNRSDEIDALLEEGEIIPEATMTQLNNHLEYALRLTGEIDGEAKIQAVNRVRNMMQIQVQHMTNLEENASEEAAQLLAQIRNRMENQLRLIDDGSLAGEGLEQQLQQGGQDQGQGQDQDQGQQGQGQDQGQGDRDQGQQGQGQDQGSGDGSGQPDADAAPGSDNEQGQSNSNQGDDPCAAYYESLAQAQGQDQSQGQGQGKGQGQGESQGPVVYGLNGEVCQPPTDSP